ncbi:MULTISPECIES: hypothetical protein [Bacillus amyloliquefaciens group]|uniref:hypothetical protein n=1 Tax=Bacillus amyloliquefaciens group TaxID=1938374 RepID=UPI0005EB76B4|nr:MULTISPECIES: hypothetical protein [Bacillus amyloliquefaciens group]KJR70871.1 hypothetical protein BAGR45_02530 [Bacillus velezensis]MEB4596466.1 DUF4365 domain-containing protein [Bacillus amyloliquefaciens]
MESENRNGKNPDRNKAALDPTIIEHLACLEINNLILQPPFHLISNIAWNDKGISYDGEILVYNNSELVKKNAVGEVKVQVKGTTTYKKVHKKGKIKHLVKKADIDVYYKFGVGVLYFVVTINPTTLKKQAYYRILAPLDLKKLLLELNNNGRDSISLDFKKLEKDTLEPLCKVFINIVKKQPQHYIELSKQMNFTSYKVDIIEIHNDSSDLFEKTAYVYGFTTDNIGIPIDVAQFDQIERVNTENIRLNDEEVNITYKIIETENSHKVVVEDTLSIELLKEKKGGSFKLGKLKTLGSYMKCLQIINYFIVHEKFPFHSFKLELRLDNKKKFESIEEDIKFHQELINVCSQIGINENYVFNNDENLPSLFNGIIKIFKNKQYELLNINNQEKLIDMKIYAINLSDYVRVRLFFTRDKFINFYSNEMLTEIGGLIPKREIPREHDQDNKILSIPDNWEDYYQRISVYSAQNVEEMTKDANFDFEVVKLSFSDKHHDIKAHLTIYISLNYINYYNKSREEKYLDFALYLNQRHLSEFSTEDIPKVNIYLIKLIRGYKLSEEEHADILDILDRAESAADKTLSFACEVLLENKVKARRIFNLLGDEEKETLIEFPIYQQYQKLN